LLIKNFLSETEIQGAPQQQPETLSLKYRDGYCKKCYWQEHYSLGSI